MSEQKSNLMQQLHEWTTAKVINPLHEAVMDGDSADCDATCEQVKKAIRAKVLESYRNGQQAGLRRVPAALQGNVTAPHREVQ